MKVDKNDTICTKNIKILKLYSRKTLIFCAFSRRLLAFSRNTSAKGFALQSQKKNIFTQEAMFYFLNFKFDV